MPDPRDYVQSIAGYVYGRLEEGATAARVRFDVFNRPDWGNLSQDALTEGIRRGVAGFKASVQARGDRPNVRIAALFAGRPKTDEIYGVRVYTNALLANGQRQRISVTVNVRGTMTVQQIRNAVKYALTSGEINWRSGRSYEIVQAQMSIKSVFQNPFVNPTIERIFD